MTEPSSSSLVELVRGSPRLRARLSRPRFVRPELDILLIDARYHLVDELRRALEGWGHRVTTVPLEESADDMVRSILTALAARSPDFVLTVNHLGFDAGGALGAILETLEVPVAAWYVDSPLFVLRGGPVPAAGVSVLFTWERSLIPTLARECEARYLPLATDPRLFAGAPVASPRTAIGFVGSSGRAAQDKWRARLGPDDEGTVRRLEQVVARREPSVFTDPALREDPQAADRLAAATWRANSRHRAELLERFGADELELHGDPGWRALLPEVAVRPGPTYGPALGAVYREVAVHLNVTSLQMPTAVNQRVFDVPAAGGFVITDAQDDVQALFAEDELVTWSSFEEAADKARFYLRRPERRRALAERARDRVLAEHTYHHRIRDLVETMRAQFGSTRAMRSS